MTDTPTSNLTTVKIKRENPSLYCCSNCPYSTRLKSLLAEFNSCSDTSSASLQPKEHYTTIIEILLNEEIHPAKKLKSSQRPVGCCIYSPTLRC